jgi:hypothetical protein
MSAPANTREREQTPLTLLRDFRQSPAELFDGIEPSTLLFQPAKFGFQDYQTVDLVAACTKHPEQFLSPDLQKNLQLLAPPRVHAFNKSSSRLESLLGYYAITNSLIRAERLIILFSFFEVSPARYHAYLHVLLKINS